MSRASRASSWRVGLITLVVVTLPARLWGQTLTVSTVADALRVQARGLTFLDGAVLERLKEGRSVRVDMELTVLAKPEGAVVTQSQQGFMLSFDLWEERFAVTRVGSPARSVSHLQARDAESWCLENLTIPLTALGRYGRETPFWLRLAYRALDVVPAADSDDGGRFTLRRLIDILSRRRGDGEPAKSIEAGPFRLPDAGRGGTPGPPSR